MSGEQSSETHSSEQEDEYRTDIAKIRLIVCFIVIVIFLTNNQLNVYSRHFPGVFRISQVNSQFYTSKLYTFRTLLTILGSLFKFAIFKIPVNNSIFSLISLLLIVVCRLVFVILLHFTEAAFIKAFYLLLYEAFLLGFFYSTLLTNVFQFSLYIIICTDVSSALVFFLQLALSIFSDNNPLLIIKIQSWTSLLLSITGFILWYHFLNDIYTPQYKKHEKSAGEINKILLGMGGLSQFINGFLTQINNEVESLKQISNAKQKAVSFLNSVKKFVTELSETKHSTNKDMKTSNYLLNTEKNLVLLDEIVSKIEKIVSLGKSKILKILSDGENLYARLNSENTVLKGLRLRKSFFEEVQTVSEAVNVHFNSLTHGANVGWNICKVVEELNIVKTIGNLYNIQDELKILWEQISSFQTKLDSVHDYKDLLKTGTPKLTKTLRILSSILKSVMDEDVHETGFLEQSYNDMKKAIVEIEEGLKAMFDDYLSKIKPISTKDASEILLTLDLLYDLKIESVIKALVNLNDLIIQIQDIRDELLSLLEEIQKFKFNLPVNSRYLFEQWNKGPNSNHVLLDSDSKYYQIQDFHNFYLRLKNTKVSELIEKFEKTVEKLRESLHECSTLISSKQVGVERFIDDYKVTIEALKELNLDKNTDKITLNEHKNKLRSLIRDIVKAIETENEGVEPVLEDLVKETLKEVGILLKKINLLVTKRNEARIKNLQSLPLLEFPSVTIGVEKDNWSFLLLTIFFNLVTMFVVTSFFLEFLFPRFIPYALLETDVSARVNLFLNPFKVSGSIALFSIIYFNADSINWTIQYNSYWLLIIPQFLIFLWSLFAVHTRIPIFTFIRNSTYSVVMIGVVLVICNSIMEAVSFVALAGNLLMLDESSKLLEIHFILSVLLRYLYSRFSIGYNNARISMGLIPPRFIPNIIVQNPVFYWMRETFWRSYRNVITDLTTNLVDLVDNP
ncbi:putative integral membrane protein [Theileria parva strain Muguga]|uniref:putative integral membrane protein n=1 Tax=Theileria parva strain Muguga TaxID=333668 RepID=UPI001C6198FE|nr:putative integral membrane protein [Theileria parva strain Muguga]KAF5153324.1 putative integral membrane protein [Theileria parva strain Muguga]